MTPLGMSVSYTAHTQVSLTALVWVTLVAVESGGSAVLLQVWWQLVVRVHMRATAVLVLSLSLSLSLSLCVCVYI